MIAWPSSAPADSTVPDLPQNVSKNPWPLPIGRAEAHLERPQHPGHQHQREGDEREHHAVDRPALLHDAAIQDRQARQAHQPHERRGGHLPRVVAGVQPTWVCEPAHVPPFPAVVDTAPDAARARPGTDDSPGMKPAAGPVGPPGQHFRAAFRHVSRRPRAAVRASASGSRKGKPALARRRSAHFVARSAVGAATRKSRARCPAALDSAPPSVLGNSGRCSRRAQARRWRPYEAERRPIASTSTPARRRRSSSHAGPSAAARTAAGPDPA